MHTWREKLSKAGSQLREPRSVTFLAGYFVWTLSAFDYFLLPVLAAQPDALGFGTGIVQHPDPVHIAFASSLTLATRLIGAFCFGAFVERFGRRRLLVIDLALCMLAQVLTATPVTAPNFGWFLAWRALFGVGLGGAWTLSAPLLMESIPDEPPRRGLFSGIFQQGYAVGNLLAALISLLFLSALGWDWHAMFAFGALLPIPLLWFLIRTGVQESPIWQAQRDASQSSVTPQPSAVTGRRTLSATAFSNALRRAGSVASSELTSAWGGLWQAYKRDRALFHYTVLLLCSLTLMSHVSQDLYPTFLHSQVNLQSTDVAWVVVIYTAGACIGGILFGYRSDVFGRRRCIVVPTAVACLLIPLWVGLFPRGESGLQPPLGSATGLLLLLGAFLMQFMVQGAYGVVPAHLTELAYERKPGSYVMSERVRGMFPGVTYHLGVLLASWSPWFVAALSEGRKLAYAQVLADFLFAVFLFVIVVTFRLGAGRDNTKLTAGGRAEEITVAPKVRLG